MKLRELEKAIKRAIKTFPAVVVTGPRQSGKTTLLKTMFPDYSYIDLEDPVVRDRALYDPRGLLPVVGGVVVDEIQYVPQLLSYIKIMIDKDRKPGRWLLTGSQAFELMAGVSQSLAGRVAVLTLLPMSVREIDGLNLPIEKLVLRGGYPELAVNKRVDREMWCSSYINTYVERDIRNIKEVADLNLFRLFVKSCAARTGQILDISGMASDLGVSVPTIKRWLSLMESCYQIRLIYPYYRNLGKRLIKAPKIYFSDTGLATYLMGINDEKTLVGGPYWGQLFETWIINELIKLRTNSGLEPQIYYLRTRDGFEADVIMETGDKLDVFEIKAGATIMPELGRKIERWLETLKIQLGKVGIISNSAETMRLTEIVTNYSWREFLDG